MRAAERGVTTGVLLSLSLNKSNRLAPAGKVPKKGGLMEAALDGGGKDVPVLPLRPTAPSAERRTVVPVAVGVVAAACAAAKAIAA